MASQVLITISKDEREQAWLRSREKYILDTQSDRAYERQQGRAEGKLEIARKMKEMGDSIERIHAITGLDMAVIEQLAN